MSINKVIMVGNLGQNAESRQVGQSTVINFSIAMTEKFSNAQGQVQERTEWANVEYWGNPNIAQYLVKGQQVYVEGSLRTDKWQDQNGQMHSATKIRAFNIQLLGSRPQAQQPVQQQVQQQAPPAPYRQQQRPPMPPNPAAPAPIPSPAQGQYQEGGQFEDLPF